MKLWIIYSIAALLCAGSGNFLMKLAFHHGFSTIATLSIVFLVNVLAASIMFFALKPDLTTSSKGLFCAIFAGILLCAMAVFLNLAYAQPNAKTGLVTAVMNSNFIWVALLSFLILKETLTLQQLGGLLLILAGLILIV